MKPLLAVFAHPDDEAFGPAGFIALEAQKREVYLICVTNGAAGKNSLDPNQNLSDIRKKELKRSAKILGVKRVFFFGYDDGSLANNLYHELALKVEKIVKKIGADTLLTYEPRGISGHLDHVAVSMITSFVFRQNLSVKNLYYYAVPEDRQEDTRRNTYFIYYPKGYKTHEIHITIKTDTVWNSKRKSMLSHASQIHDAKVILKRLEDLPKEEHFLIEER